MAPESSYEESENIAPRKNMPRGKYLANILLVTILKKKFCLFFMCVSVFRLFHKDK